MRDLKSILITLREPSKISFNKEILESSRLILDDKVLSPPRFPLWATCADILVNSVKKEFVGLCYYVGDDSKDLVKSFIKDLNPFVARFVNSSLDNEAKPYLKCNLNPSHFQIKWSAIEADNIEVAQLGSDYWYYLEDGKRERQLMAIGLNYVDEILGDYNLNFPNTDYFNIFKPTFTP